MPGLRRRSGLSHSCPIAAEVLETRSLLSAAGAVHAAVHHTAAVHDTTITPKATQVLGSAQIFLSPSIQGTISGHFTTVKPAQSTGAKVTFKFQAVATIGPVTETFKATFAGNITGVNGVGGSEFFTVAPKGGSFLLTIKSPEGPEKFAGKNDTTPLTFKMTGGTFAEVQGTFALSPKNSPLANEGTGSIDIKVTN